MVRVHVRAHGLQNVCVGSSMDNSISTHATPELLRRRKKTILTAVSCGTSSTIDTRYDKGISFFGENVF